MNIIGIVVTFEPKTENLGKLFDALIPQVNKVVVIDNFSSINLEKFVTSNKVEYIQLTQNFGIAYAQNIGIQWAENFGATHVLLMDQDSVPNPDMVSKLSSVIIENQENSSGIHDVAAVGPSYIDIRSNKKSFFVIEKNKSPKRWVPDKECMDCNGVEVMFLIASGTLIPVEILKVLGGFRSGYFIDHVDTEWSFRAKSRGYRLIGVSAAQMLHNLGDEIKTFWFFGWRQVSYHSPLRDYYMFRNTLLMIKETEMSWRWQLHFLWRLMQFFCYFLVFSSYRIKRLYLMLLGLWHGYCRVDGKLDLITSRCMAIPNND